MATSDLSLTIRAQTAEFVKAIKDIESKTKVIANQMAEIDKQLKMENVDRVQKLSEKIQALDKMLNNARNETSKYVEILNLQKTSLVNAEKEVAKKQIALEKLDKEYKDGKISAKEYEEQHKKLSSEYESGQKSVEKVRSSVESYAEKIRLAEQKSLTLAEQLKKTANEFEQEKAAADKTESELGDLAATTEKVADASDKAEKETEETSNAIEDAGNAANSASKDMESFKNSVLANLASAAIQKGISTVVGLFKSLASAAWNAAKGIASSVKNFVTESIELAKNMEETRSKVYAVFGEEGQKVMEEWANNAAHDFHTTKQAAMEAAAEYGNILTGLGMAKKEAQNYAHIRALAVEVLKK